MVGDAETAQQLFQQLPPLEFVTVSRNHVTRSSFFHGCSETSVRKGDAVVVIERYGDGWAKIEHNGIIGIIPETVVNSEMLEKERRTSSDSGSDGSDSATVKNSNTSSGEFLGLFCVVAFFLFFAPFYFFCFFCSVLLCHFYYLLFFTLSTFSPRFMACIFCCRARPSRGFPIFG